MEQRRADHRVGNEPTKGGPIVLCCHRANLSGVARMGGAAFPQSPAKTSFLRRTGWREFRDVLAGLRAQCPTAMPVVVRTAWLPDTILGQCIDLSYGSMTRWKSRRPSNACCTNGRMLWRGTFRSTGSPRCRGSILRCSTGPAMTRLGAAPIRGFGGLTAIVEAAQNVIDKGF